jgi:hypothetical protein
MNKIKTNWCKDIACTFSYTTMIHLDYATLEMKLTVAQYTNGEYQTTMPSV